MEEMQLDDIADARVVEAMREDLKKLYNEIGILVQKENAESLPETSMNL